MEKPVEDYVGVQNAGYTVRLATRTEGGDVIVLAHGAARGWVTWMANPRNDATNPIPSFFWGHYFGAQLPAVHDYLKRVSELTGGA